MPAWMAPGFRFEKGTSFGGLLEVMKAKDSETTISTEAIVRIARGRTGGEGMRIDLRVFAISLLVGIGLVLLDILLGHSVPTFSSLGLVLREDILEHEMFMRILVLITFAGFGLVVARQVYVIRQAEIRAARSSFFLQQLLNAIPVPIFYKNRELVYIGCNENFGKYLGRPIEEIIGRTVYDLAPKHLAEIYQAKDQELMDNPGVQVYESMVKGGTTEERNVIFHKATFCDNHGRVDGMIGVILDITELRQTEAQRERLIADLRDAIDRVKVLSGFLPICATCKKIRNDSGYWQQLEAYIHEHSQAVFSHSICPDCAKKLFADYEAEQRKIDPKLGHHDDAAD